MSEKLYPPNCLGEVMSQVSDEMDEEVSPAQASRWIWSALNAIHADHLFSWMIKNTQLTVASGADYVLLPFDCRKIRNLWLLDASYVKVRKLYQDIDYAVRPRDEDTIVTPGSEPVINEADTGLFGSRVDFWNETTGTEYVQIEHWRWARRPVEHGDICDVHPAHVDLLVNGACYRAARHLREYQQSQMYYNDFSHQLQMLVDQDVLRFGDAKIPIPYTIDGNLMDWRESEDTILNDSDTDVFTE